jgi:hypothetical protein
MTAEVMDFMKSMAGIATDMQSQKDSADLVRDEMSAWDGYALAWIESHGNLDEGDTDAIARFANAMIQQRRRAFGLDVVMKEAADAV